MNLHRVLCLSQGTGFLDAVDHLRSGGWTVLLADDVAAARRVLGTEAIHLGLLLLEQPAPDQLKALDDLLHFSHRSRTMEWLGVFGVKALDAPAFRELVLNYFFDHHMSLPSGPELEATALHALQRVRLRAGLEAEGQAGTQEASLGMIGQSEAIRQLRRQIRKVAPTEAPVLIAGESGSGKELAARAIHQSSRRAAGPFVAINCGAITAGLIQSELFGHERGSFTGANSHKVGLIESAHGGSLFLDEIADLPLELQTNLLRFLQERTIQRVGANSVRQVDARVMAASHVDLAAAVSAGQFREDLFYRLSVLPITVPALRERLSDVPFLARHFLGVAQASQHSQRVQGFSRQAMAVMMAHTWPGNVRELGNRVQRAVVMSDHRLLSPADLGLLAQDSHTALDLEAVRTLAERDAIALTLGRVDRNVTHAARELGVSRMTMYRLMDKHGLASRTPS